MNHPLVSLNGVSSSAVGVLKNAARYIPTPGGQFANILKGISDVGQAALGGDVLGGGTAELGELLQAQMETQMRMQSITMASNIEKSSHESKMAAIRNVRVG